MRCSLEDRGEWFVIHQNPKSCLLWTESVSQGKIVPDSFKYHQINSTLKCKLKCFQKSRYDFNERLAPLPHIFFFSESFIFILNLEVHLCFSPDRKKRIWIETQCLHLLFPQVKDRYMVAAINSYAEEK